MSDYEPKSDPTTYALLQEAILAAEQRGYLRGLHDAWHNIHIRRFDKDGGPWVEGSPHTVDTYYSGVIRSQHVIGELWLQAGRPDGIGGNLYEEFPVTDLNTAGKPTPTD